LALQLSLAVQLPVSQGGLAGSACYLTTHAKLPTQRLSQVIEEHQLFTATNCQLEDIHTMSVPTVDILLLALNTSLRGLQAEISRSKGRKPIKLVVVDALSTLLGASEKTSSKSLTERSRALTSLSEVMHALAYINDIAFVIVNNVRDVFHHYRTSIHDIEAAPDVTYNQQSFWFNSAHSVPGGGRKESTLGLVWANQVNVRIILTRTNRRRAVEEVIPPWKRRRTEQGEDSTSRSDTTQLEGNSDLVLRQLAVVFSSVCQPRSIDFIVTKAGISTVSNTEQQAELVAPVPPFEKPLSFTEVPTSTLDDLRDVGDEVYWEDTQGFTDDVLLNVNYDESIGANFEEEIVPASQLQHSSPGAPDAAFIPSSIGIEG
jgi:DNA repair protein RAD57